ncbi:hypothetical protein LTR95_005980 [Oleoguttula sp. CCFEE 5521]
MADPEVIVDVDDIEETMPDITAEEEEAGDEEATSLEGIEPTIAERTGFIDYLKSPIVELSIGSGDDHVILSAHQALLEHSPYLAGEIASLPSNAPRRIAMPEDDVHAAAAVLEFIYKGDYFPTLSSGALEYDPTVPSPDDSGIALLRHARVYTLAQKFGLPQLSALAHKKIHLTGSTAKGEIAYARFVYKETATSDDQIRRPVAAFWATRSHVLRHEAEQEFKKMCLEFPQFGYDVLSLVLDAQEKRSQRQERQESSQVGTSGRKRQRTGQ